MSLSKHFVDFICIYTNVLPISDEGSIAFMLKMVNEKILLFHYFNKNRRNDVTRVAGVLGKCHT